MSNFTFTQTIPAAPNNPSNDQPLMLQNNAATFGWAAVDHLGFNTNNGGYHNVVHWNNQLVDPPLLTGFGQLYTKSVTQGTVPVTDNQLFYQSAQVGTNPLFGVITQLTGPLAPIIAPPGGSTTLPGGLMLLFGASPGGFSGSINFTPNFPTACLTVVATPFLNSGGNTFAVRILLFDKAHFAWSSNGSNTGLNWIAIGN